LAKPSINDAIARGWSPWGAKSERKRNTPGPGCSGVVEVAVDIGSAVSGAGRGLASPSGICKPSS
jgi:hypothetical protein